MISDKVRLFYKQIKEKRIPQSALKALPFIGNSLEELIYGGDVEEFISVITQQTIENQNTILSKIDFLLEQNNNMKPVIISVGGANSEDIFKLDTNLELEIGEKHTVETQELFGGSGVNHTMRLLSVGYDVLPILSIGQDSIGKSIRKKIIKAAITHKASPRVLEYIDNNNSSEFYDPNIKTPSATIIVENSRRTIFTQKLENGSNFINHVKKRVELAEDILLSPPSAIMVGHIHTDSKENSAIVTKYLINKFKNRSTIFLNPGSSQLSLGLEFWKEDLRNVDFFQVNLYEAKDFFRGDSGELLKLTHIIKLIRKLNINAIITLDKFGAIGIHKNDKSSVFIAWPVLDANEVVDPTGAGDAFAAGLVGYLINSSRIDDDAFRNAMSQARVWAAYACGTYGGASQCPSEKELNRFVKSISLRSNRAVEIRDQSFAAEILTLLDIAFQ